MGLNARHAVSLLAALLLRLLTAALLTAIVLGLGFVGVLTGTLPRPLALILEPFSLLLLPGIVPALLVAGSHDFSPKTLLTFAGTFYLIVFFWALGRWQRTTAP